MIYAPLDDPLEHAFRRADRHGGHLALIKLIGSSG